MKNKTTFRYIYCVMYSCFKITTKLERERERESLALDINCPMLYAFIWKACLSPHVMWYLCVGSAIAYLLMTMNLLLLSFSFRPISSGYLKMNQDQTPFLTFNHAMRSTSLPAYPICYYSFSYPLRTSPPAIAIYYHATHHHLRPPTELHLPYDAFLSVMTLLPEPPTISPAQSSPATHAVAASRTRPKLVLLEFSPLYFFFSYFYFPT